MATIPPFTDAPAGTGFRIAVVGSDGVIYSMPMRKSLANVHIVTPEEADDTNERGEMQRITDDTLLFGI